MKHIHFIGIGGIGMSGIAQVLLAKGYRISGSDLKMSHITDKLVASGAVIYCGHSAENLKGADSVVVSSAISGTNVELVAARDMGLAVFQRAEMLSFLINDQVGIAVSGTHGKTTTTSMIAFVMDTYGLDPTAIIGGELLSLSSNASAGSGAYLVAEADESDASFLHLSPFHAVITNIDSDVNFNIEPYKSSADNYSHLMQTIMKVFLDFTGRVSGEGTIFLCTDSEYVRKIMPFIDKKIVTYAITHQADIHAENIILSDFCSEADIYLKSCFLGKLKLRVPGRHNVQNALACIGVCLELGLSSEKIMTALEDFGGLRRRFEVLADRNGVIVVDDYAHNPSKLRAAVHAARTGSAKRVVAVFQPHRYSRTRMLFNELSEAFDEVDVLLVTDIYSAGEPEDKIYSASALADLIRRKSPQVDVYYVDSKDNAIDWLKNNYEQGDIIITLGAGDICKVSHFFADNLDDIVAHGNSLDLKLASPIE